MEQTNHTSIFYTMRTSYIYNYPLIHSTQYAQENYKLYEITIDMLHALKMHFQPNSASTPLANNNS